MLSKVKRILSRQTYLECYSIAERWIRTIRKRVRININTQPYSVCDKLLEHVIYKPIMDLTDTPNSKTMNQTPREISDSSET